MTAPRISKVEARKRAHEATRRANEARAARDKANIDDAADFLVAVGKIAEVESWKKERLAQLRAQVDAEAAKRVAVHRAKAGAAIARMQGRGETLTTIAARTDVGIGVVRTMARHARNPRTLGRGRFACTRRGWCGWRAVEGCWPLLRRAAGRCRLGVNGAGVAPW
ncbi:hypothetical protein MGALJ_61940 (plasmid) [Mycobacterium gallinarum]|uniref:Uncharacterized protein n=1 Tax=Mycobacterium gallinarum TaxID=39689 RepID=A0A9W4B9W0_9MYCO|nr:hypothetical protein [Mycobacterium gallinarum]BBY96525.1 hypothetical protein MGALJ_61940 [Mycobacterium gallinarum]